MVAKLCDFKGGNAVILLVLMVEIARLFVFNGHVSIWLTSKNNILFEEDKVRNWRFCECN